MRPIKEKISITIDGPTLDEIRRLAEREDRSLSSCIDLVLRDHLRQLPVAGK